MPTTSVRYRFRVVSVGAPVVSVTTASTAAPVCCNIVDDIFAPLTDDDSNIEYVLCSPC